MWYNMRRTWYLLLLIFGCSSCSTLLEPVLGVCNGEMDPINNLEWMRGIISQHKDKILLITEIEAKQYIYEDTICVRLDEMFYGYQLYYRNEDELGVTCNNIHSYNCQGKLLDTGCSSFFSYLEEESQHRVYVKEAQMNVIYENLSARDERALKKYFDQRNNTFK